MRLPRKPCVFTFPGERGDGSLWRRQPPRVHKGKEWGRGIRALTWSWGDGAEEEAEAPVGEGVQEEA